MPFFKNDILKTTVFLLIVDARDFLHNMRLRRVSYINQREYTLVFDNVSLLLTENAQNSQTYQNQNKVRYHSKLKKINWLNTHLNETLRS